MMSCCRRSRRLTERLDPPRVASVRQCLRHPAGRGVPPDRFSPMELPTVGTFGVIILHRLNRILPPSNKLTQVLAQFRISSLGSGKMQYPCRPNFTRRLSPGTALAVCPIKTEQRSSLGLQY